MSVLGDVFGSLEAMSLGQLLLAFLACIGYVFAQGGLVGPRTSRYAWGLAALGAAGFALLSGEPMYAAMLLAFAIAGLGLFVAAVWLTSRMLGLARSRAPALIDEAPADPISQPSVVWSRPSRTGDHAHSI